MNIRSTSYLSKMELVVKLPKDKPPFIGIVFENRYEASRLNQDLVNQHKDKLFTIVLEPIARINLRLICSEINFFYQYMSLKCDAEKLKRWMQNINHDTKINFSHLIREKDKDIVIETMTDRKLFVLKVESIRILDDY